MAKLQGKAGRFAYLLQTLINLLHVHRERFVDQNVPVNIQVVGDDFPDPGEMQVSPIKLILAGPASSGDNQAGNLFSSKLFRINDDIEIAVVIDVDAIDLEVPCPVLLIALQGAI